MSLTTMSLVSTIALGPANLGNGHPNLMYVQRNGSTYLYLISHDNTAENTPVATPQNYSYGQLLGVMANQVQSSYEFPSLNVTTPSDNLAFDLAY
jgi:hypothetical protein